MTGHKNIDDLRTLLFETIEAVKSGEMDIDRAKAISSLSQVMVNSAAVEAKHLQAIGQKGSGFLEKPEQLPPGITGSHTHRVRG